MKRRLHPRCPFEREGGNALTLRRASASALVILEFVSRPCLTNIVLTFLLGARFTEEVRGNWTIPYLYFYAWRCVDDLWWSIINTCVFNLELAHSIITSLLKMLKFENLDYLDKASAMNPILLTGYRMSGRVNQWVSYLNRAAYVWRAVAFSARRGISTV